MRDAPERAKAERAGAEAPGGPGTGLRFACTRAGAIARTRRILTGSFVSLSLLLVVAAWWVFRQERVVPVVLLLVLAFFLQFVLRLFLDTGPAELWLGSEELVVSMNSGAREALPLAEIREARRLTVDELAHLSRLAEHAGLVVGTGSFDSHLLGEIDLYATDLDHTVLVATEERAWVVTPDAPEDLLGAIAATIAPS